MATAAAAAAAALCTMIHDEECQMAKVLRAVCKEEKLTKRHLNRSDGIREIPASVRALANFLLISMLISVLQLNANAFIRV